MKDKPLTLLLNFFLLSLLAASLAPTAAAQEMTPKARMAILRGMIAEYATLRVALPRGEKGLQLSAEGEIDQDSLMREITQHGSAATPNNLVQITNIAFRNKEIVFEINGGGKKKTKWTDRIEVGMGSRTTPLTAPDGKTPTGSAITIEFSAKLPELTTDELKALLNPVLDFTPVNPLQTINVPVPPEFQKAIEDKQAVEGMSRDIVLAALGPPDHKVREMKDGVEQEDWIYGKPPLKVVFVTFEDDQVVKVEEHQGGVHGSVQTYPKQPPR